MRHSLRVGDVRQASYYTCMSSEIDQTLTMKFTLDNPSADYVFGHYGDGVLKVNQTDHHSSLIIFPDALIQDWPVKSIDDLQISHFDDIVKREPDIVLLGTGLQQRFPPVEFRRSLVQAGLNLEIMDTAAACRTYNLLVSEGRDVAAAVIIY